MIRVQALLATLASTIPTVIWQRCAKTRNEQQRNPDMSTPRQDQCLSVLSWQGSNITDLIRRLRFGPAVYH
jgi:hypothetical protein